MVRATRRPSSRAAAGLDPAGRAGQERRSRNQGQAFRPEEASLEFQRKERESLEELRGGSKKPSATTRSFRPTRARCSSTLRPRVCIQIVDRDRTVRCSIPAPTQALHPRHPAPDRQGPQCRAQPGQPHRPHRRSAVRRGDRGFSNWELSITGPNASRRELIAGGMDESKVLRVVGGLDGALRQERPVESGKLGGSALSS